MYEKEHDDTDEARIDGQELRSLTEPGSDARLAPHVIARIEPVEVDESGPPNP